MGITYLKCDTCPRVRTGEPVVDTWMCDHGRVVRQRSMCGRRTHTEASGAYQRLLREDGYATRVTVSRRELSATASERPTAQQPREQVASPVILAQFPCRARAPR